MYVVCLTTCMHVGMYNNYLYACMHACVDTTTHEASTPSITHGIQTSHDARAHLHAHAPICVHK